MHMASGITLETMCIAHYILLVSSNRAVDDFDQDSEELDLGPDTPPPGKRWATGEEAQRYMKLKGWNSVNPPERLAVPENWE